MAGPPLPEGRGVLKAPVLNPRLGKPPPWAEPAAGTSPRSLCVSADKTVTPKQSRRGGRWQKPVDKTSLVFDASLDAEGT